MAAAAPAPALEQKMSRNPGKIGIAVFGVALIVGLIYTIVSLARDLQVERGTSIYPYVLLGVALLVALGFEFVNGFHDTANAVATVIYTHSMEPHLAVAWSGAWNFIGVLLSIGRRRIHHHHFAAGGVDPASRQRARASRWSSPC